MKPRTQLSLAIIALLIVALGLSASVIYVLQRYTGLAVLTGEAGRITTVNLIDARPAYFWHGFYGIALMVKGINLPQRARITGYGITQANLIFPCMQYKITHEIYASPSPVIDWESVEPAEPEFIDSYFNITQGLVKAKLTFTRNMSIMLGNRNISNIPAVYTYVNSQPQQSRFPLGILKDSNNNPIFVTRVEDFTTGFRGDTINYQMMVAIPYAKPITYYFFTDPYDFCPAGEGELLPDGNITGQVTDKASGRPIEGVMVIIGNKLTTTNSSGHYNLKLEGGRYYIVAIKAGYNNYVDNVTVVPMNTTVKNIQMVKAPEQQAAAGGTGTGIGPGQDVGPGIGPYFEQPRRTEGISHYVTLRSISRILRIGQFFEEEIYFFNYGDTIAEEEIEVTGEVAPLVELDKTKLRILPDSHESFKVRVLGRGEEGIYNGSIKLKGTYDEYIPVSIVLTSKDKLPIEALLLDIAPITKEVYEGRTLKFKVDVRNLISDQEYNVSLTYTLFDPKHNHTIVLGSEIFLLKTSLSLIKSYILDKGLPLGDKVLSVRAEYLDATTLANTVITIVQPFYVRKLFGVIPVWWGLVFVGFLLLLFPLLIFIRRKIEEKKRYHLKVDYKTLPQKGGPKSVYIGKIAETNRPAYFELDKLTTHAIVAGSTGGGKTISAQVLVEECLKNNVAVVVFDPTAQWSGFLRKLDSENLLKLYPEFGMSKTEARAFNGNVRQIQDAREKINLKKFFRPGEIQVFTTDKLDPKDIDIFVTNTVREVFHEHFDEAAELKYLMVYDEVHRLLPRFGGSGEGFVQIERACREFRKWGIGVLLVSQVLTDFASQIKANINTEIQMRTRDEEDLKRIATKYGKEVLRSLVKATVGTGMLENPAWNYGKPYFVSWRPILHSVHRLKDEELAKYNKYNQIIDDLEFQLEQLRELGEDVFDLELELKLALDKVKSGNFNMVDIYLEGLTPELQKRWDKLGKKPKQRRVELVDLKEIEEAVEQARKEREKYLKEKANEGAESPNPAAQEKAIDRFAQGVGAGKALNLDNGLSALSLNELIDVLDATDDETYARHVNENRNDIADWVEKAVGEPSLAASIRGKSRLEAIEAIKLAKIESGKTKQEKTQKSPASPTPTPSKKVEAKGAAEPKAEKAQGESKDKPEVKLEAKAETSPDKPETISKDSNKQLEKKDTKSDAKTEGKAVPNRLKVATSPFYLEGGGALRTIGELIGAVKFMDPATFSKYANQYENHFANWVEHCLQDADLARKLREAKSQEECLKILEGLNGDN